VRPEERHRREAQAAAAKGEGQPAQPTSVNILQQRTYTAFLLGPVESLPDGSKVATFLTPDGVAHLWPLNEQAAQQLGQQLLAPSVQVAGVDEMPRTNGHDPRGGSVG
jgi:hypothetical protein